MTDIAENIIRELYESATFFGAYVALFLCVKATLSRRSLLVLSILAFATNAVYHHAIDLWLPNTINLNVPRVVIVATACLALAAVVFAQRPRSFDRVLALGSNLALFLVTFVNHVLLVDLIMEERFEHHITNQAAAFTAQSSFGPKTLEFCERASLACYVLPRNADNSLAPHDHIIIVNRVLQTPPGTPHIMVGRAVEPIENSHIALLVNFPDTSLLVQDRQVSSRLFYETQTMFRVSLAMFMAIWAVGLFMVIRRHNRLTGPVELPVTRDNRQTSPPALAPRELANN